MKTPTKFIALLSGAALLSSSAFAESVSTGVVGYTSTTLPAGVGSVYAPAFVNADAAAGVLSAAASTTVTVSSIVAGAYDEGATFPAYYLEILDDTNGADGFDTEGLILDVVSNTGTVVTLASDAVALGVQGDEQYRIRKHLTIADLTAGATGFAFFDAVSLYNASSIGSIDSYFFDGAGGWFDGGVNYYNDAVIYPGTGVVFNTQGAVTLTATGSVKETATQVPLYAGEVNIVGVMKPVVAFDVESDGEISSALSLFDGLTQYEAGTLAVANVALLGFADLLTSDGTTLSPVVIDGTNEAMVLSVSSSSVYKASGTTVN